MLDFNSGSRISSEELSKQISSLIDQALTIQSNKQEVRKYLGASRIGVSCNRALQFEYSNFSRDEGQSFTGRILRIFQAGHIFEDLAISWLRESGFELMTHKEDGNQFGFSAAEGQLKGHIDGVIVNAPDRLNLKFPMLWECKSLNNKSWKDAVKKGLTISKPIYAAQIAIYQAYMESTIEGISKNPALFTAINKDTAQIYFELIPFDKALAQSLSDRAVKIIKATESGELLPGISRDRSYYECKFCPWQERCAKVSSNQTNPINQIL